MKRFSFLTLFIGAQICMIMLHVHKNNTRIAQTYLTQKKENLKNNLLIERQELIEQLYLISDRSRVKEFAEQELAMEPVQLKQIKKISMNDHESNS